MKSFFSGLVVGFGLLILFGLLASFTLASDITNLFTTLGGLCLIACPIIGVINGRKERANRRTVKADQQSRSANIERSLKGALATMNLGCGTTQETFKRYADACDTLVYFCAEYSFSPLYENLVKPYRQAVYARTWPVYRWRNAKYEYVPGIELAEVLQEEIRKRGAEREEERKRRQSYHSY
ncbi:MAG: hypothetical protein E7457_05275 [Ruminococcaceae bacterium]|nr:hypothetical protein [Oscillospiraceae bacterium]